MVATGLSEHGRLSFLEALKVNIIATRNPRTYPAALFFADDEKKRELEVQLHKEGNTMKDICRSLSISKPTLYRYFRSQA